MPFRDATTELSVGLGEVTDGPFDDVLAAHLPEAPCDVVHQTLLRVLRLQTIEVAGLHEVVDLPRHPSKLLGS
jgi:hypothetical protein